MCEAKRSGGERQVPRFLALPLVLAGAFALLAACRTAPATPEELPMALRATADGLAIVVDETPWAHCEIPSLGGGPAHVETSAAGDGWQRVRLTWQLAEPLAQDQLEVLVRPAFTPDFRWAPHLAPEDDDCIGQHVFRSPALIAAQGTRTLVLVPDLELCGADPATPWFLDVDARANTMSIGMSKTEIPRHVEFKKTGGMVLPAGEVELAFFVAAYVDDQEPRNPWGRVAAFLWDRHGHPLLEAGQPHTVPMDRYVEHVYRWAFETWQDAVWQEFELGGERVGAPAFIVNVTESPNYPGEPTLREFLSIWNQAWFSSLRSASGLQRYAARTGDEGLRRRAELTKDFALAAPMKEGIFPAVYRTEMEDVEVEGEKVRRSKGWETGHWVNSNRVPWERGVTDRWYHVLDASWTCLLMLRWHGELERDGELVQFARTYADALLELQDEDGFFPAWLHPETLAPAEALAQSPETSMSVTFLLELVRLTGDEHYADAALRAMDAVLAEIVPDGRWEDYETYWSCCGYGKESLYGKRDARSGMYKQNTLSMFWTAEALLTCFRATGDERYLAWGRRTLDELSMAQQVWQPPFIHIPALGGFGVMNFDGEWNDSRQCLFAELFLDYYRETGDARLFERGITALRSAFVMMYCPENPQVKTLWEKVYPWFGPEDYGFTMENYAHGGHASKDGGGMGTFTIYDWGNGAAAEARNRVFDHYGDVYIDRERGHAFGIDAVDVRLLPEGYVLHNLGPVARDVKVVFEDGSSRTHHFTAGGDVLTILRLSLDGHSSHVPR